jgi:hypothetical protein
MLKTIWIIAVHSINGVLVERMDFSDQDEIYLEDEQGWAYFDDYVKYYTDERINELEQGFYSAVAVENEERLSIIKELKDGADGI